MEIDRKRLNQYLDKIASESCDMEKLLRQPDNEIVGDPHRLKSLKYSTIVVAEAIASTLQHILAKRHNTVLDGYMQVFRKAEEYKILPDDLILRLQPFLRFRNMLVHQYWRVEDRIFLENLRDGLKDFHVFGKAIRDLCAEHDSQD